MMAAATPKSQNIKKKLENTEVMAASAKSSGESKRANTAITPRFTAMPLYFATARKSEPATSWRFTDGFS